jgi:hypothetical protein
MVESEVKKEFEQLRLRMVSLGMKYGLTHPQVLECSQKLDLLHNQIIKLKSWKTKNYCQMKL